MNDKTETNPKLNSRGSIPSVMHDDESKVKSVSKVDEVVRVGSSPTWLLQYPIILVVRVF